ncbi:MAG: pyridoxal-dependent decarboxylase [Phycisphaerales bacterium]
MTLEQPRHMTPDEFRRHGHAMVDWIAEYLRTVEERPVRSNVAPGWVRAQLPTEPPQTGEPWEAIAADVDRVVLPGVTHWQSPNFFAYFPANASGPAILGELLSAGLGIQGMLWATSPACTELETHVLDWLLQMLGLPQCFHSSSAGGGVIQDTASSATLCALIAARERATEQHAGALGLAACPQQLVAYATQHAHSSVEKAMRIAGLGASALRLVPTRADHSMDAGAFMSMVEADLAAGRTPFFCVACIGTTGSHAVDPVPQLGAHCRRRGIWLHVDAAHLGTAALCPEFRSIHQGVEMADSYCVNPHKWMLVNFDCDAFWVQDRAALVRALSVLPEYLRNTATESGKVIDYRDWQVPLGRRFRALKLWFVIRHYGAEGLQAMVRHHIALAERFRAHVRADSRFELVAPTPWSLVCFRFKAGCQASEALLQAVNATGRAYLSHTRLDDRFVLRFSVGAPTVEARHVDAAWALLQELAPA